MTSLLERSCGSTTQLGRRVSPRTPSQWVGPCGGWSSFQTLCVSGGWWRLCTGTTGHLTSPWLGPCRPTQLTVLRAYLVLDQRGPGPGACALDQGPAPWSRGLCPGPGACALVPGPAPRRVPRRGGAPGDCGRGQRHAGRRVATGLQCSCSCFPAYIMHKAVSECLCVL